jgi:hypothetical protein
VTKAAWELFSPPNNIVVPDSFLGEVLHENRNNLKRYGKVFNFVSLYLELKREVILCSFLCLVEAYCIG